MSERKDAYEVGFRDGLEEALRELNAIPILDWDPTKVSVGETAVAEAYNVSRQRSIDRVSKLIEENRAIDQLIKNSAED